MPSLVDQGARMLQVPRAALLGVDPQGRITLAAHIEPILGYTDEQVLGWPIARLVVHPDPVLRSIHAARAGTEQMIEARCRRGDGSQFTAEISASAVHTPAGTQTWVAVREAPLWHRAMVNQQLLSFIAATSSNAIISTTLDGTITYWNPAAQQMYGYTAQQTIGKPIQMLYNDPTGSIWPGIAAELRQGRQVCLERAERVRKDGTRVYVSVTLTPIPGPDTAIVGAASVTHDLSSSDRADARFQALLQAAAMAVVGVGPHGQILMVNPEAEQLFGYHSSELIGQPVEVLVPEAERQAHARLRAQYLHAPRTRRMGAGMVLTGLRKDRTAFPVEISLAPLATDDGPLVAAVIRDLTQETERQRLEQQLQQTRRLEALGQLAGGVAHDFNNIMGIIGGYAEFLTEDIRTAAPEQLEHTRGDLLQQLDQIRNAVHRANDLTRQLLAFGHRQPTRPQPVEVTTVVREVTTLLGRTLGEHVRVALQLDDAPHVMIDPGQLEQVLVNTAINARDAMPAGGTLTIDTGLVEVDHVYAQQRQINPGRYVRLRIADTGTGMTTETAAHAFEPFFTTKPTGQGNGLGLSTVHGIITRHHGWVTIYSEPGHGTTISILLPAIDQPSPQPEPTTQPPRSDPTSPADLTARTVLIVDDETALRDITRRIITAMGHQVLLAPDGPTALHLADEHPGTIDLLVTDVIMPGMLGKELADTLTARRPGLPVLYMSGYAQPVLTAQGILNHDTHLLEKPFTEAELRNAVNTALHHTAPPTPT